MKMVDDTVTSHYPTKVSFQEPGYEEDKFVAEKMDRAEAEKVSESSESPDETDA